MATPLLEVTALSKGFPGVKALDAVDLTVQAGEIHALMGENGAGKSTLIKVLTGVFPRDAGETRLEGKNYRAKVAARGRSAWDQHSLSGGESDPSLVGRRKYLSRPPADLARRHPMGRNCQAGAGGS